jgi:hypothetical protein
MKTGTGSTTACTFVLSKTQSVVATVGTPPVAPIAPLSGRAATKGLRKTAGILRRFRRFSKRLLCLSAHRGRKRGGKAAGTSPIINSPMINPMRFWTSTATPSRLSVCARRRNGSRFPSGPSILVAEAPWKWTMAFLAVSITGSLRPPGTRKAYPSPHCAVPHVGMHYANDNSNLRSTACLPCGQTCSFSQNGCASMNGNPYYASRFSSL